MKNAGLVATRRSLVDRLANWDDQKRWQEFFDTYWRLIYEVAIRSGLTEAEAQDVVQETVLSVAKKMGEFKTDPSFGSFKSWLLQLTAWRIADQFRNRQRHIRPAKRLADTTARTATASFTPWMTVSTCAGVNSGNMGKETNSAAQRSAIGKSPRSYPRLR